ncbi:hypothetical protein C8J56DRAFT_1166265 [Mycena floridula]|nr:hypothetical protein C8J56DRAFT_1166265 [Mycena floridula]
MATKQLGKWRQWAGEVISSRDKTTVSEEFKELESDMELRKSGVQRLHIVSETYHHVLSKKTICDAVEDTDKHLPVEALGIAMIAHGEEFGDDSVFGTSLVKFGRAHCQIATLQETFAINFHDTFFMSLEKFQDDIREYEHQRKKLESRRLTLDAAIAKADKAKNGKKDKDKKEAEEEMQTALERYEEIEEQVRVQMHDIQENEIDQLRELTSFLDLELNFVEQYLQVLKETKSEWNGAASRKAGSPHVFNRKETKKSRSVPVVEAESSDDESTHIEPRHRRADSTASRGGGSRPASRASKKRSDSIGTAGGREKEEKSSKKLSMVGWASSAVGSVTSIGKKSKDREKFASLQDEEKKREQEEDEDDEGSPVSRTSGISLPSLRRKHSRSKSKDSPKVSAARILKPPSAQDKKLVRALHDFAGSSDELAFKAGDEIAVVNEVLDDWWMGELNGKRGLFPTSYTKVISRPQPNGNSVPLSDDESGGWRASDISEDEAWSSKPMSPSHHSHSPFYGVAADIVSITSADEEDIPTLEPSLSRSESRNTPQLPPRPSSRASEGAKKAPPPPPPRRLSSHAPTPPVPDRRPKILRAKSSQSSTASTSYFMTPSSSLSSHEYDISPFDSAADVNNGQCERFKQNPFKPKGMCSNCLTFHT